MVIDLDYFIIIHFELIKGHRYDNTMNHSFYLQNHIFINIILIKVRLI
jgi:hypothetical protein